MEQLGNYIEFLVVREPGRRKVTKERGANEKQTVGEGKGVGRGERECSYFSEKNSTEESVKTEMNSVLKS